MSKNKAIALIPKVHKRAKHVPLSFPAFFFSFFYLTYDFFSFFSIFVIQDKLILWFFFFLTETSLLVIIPRYSHLYEHLLVSIIIAVPCLHGRCTPLRCGLADIRKAIRPGKYCHIINLSGSFTNALQKACSAVWCLLLIRKVSLKRWFVPVR